jgi:hypothetical protein
MYSKQTDDNQKKVVPDDYLPQSTRGKAKVSELTKEEKDEALKKALCESIGNSDGTINSLLSEKREDTIAGNDTIQPIVNSDVGDSLQTELAKLDERNAQPVIKRTSQKQRKDSLEEYRQTFLTIPKLDDRKPVFVSREVRDRIDEIVHRLGGRGRSVSGFIENLARHHLEIYRDDVELWKKL